MVITTAEINDTINLGFESISNLETKLSVVEQFSIDHVMMDRLRLSSLKLQVFLTHLIQLAQKEPTPTINKQLSLLNSAARGTIANTKYYYE